MLKTPWTLQLLSTTLLLVLFSPSVLAETLTITPNPFSVQEIQGVSGGTINSEGCGYIRENPNQVIDLPQDMDYLKISVITTEGSPTLVIDGPSGRTCAFADQITGTNPQLSGLWKKGRYAVYIGDRSNNANSPFILRIEQ